MIDITSQVSTLLEQEGIRQGYVILFVPHTTAAITINENADPDVKRDMLAGLSTISPDNPSYQHYEGNSDAHIKSSMIGVDQMVLIEDGRLVLGTWQGLYFCEFDGPRTRRCHITFISTT
jgi:secondary thiamine-phosphate synthase enzyme